MRKNIVLPFRQIHSNSRALNPGSWFTRGSKADVGVYWLEHGVAVKDWSYNSSLTLGREIKIDTEILAEELDLTDSKAEFELIHLMRIGGLGIRKILHRETLKESTEITYSFVKQVKSSELCEEIVLTSNIILKSHVTGVPQWAPTRQGSLCWSDEIRVVLEGYGSRFPMQEVKFTDQYKLPNNASWHLEWNPGLLHYSFNSAVMLFLNSDRDDFFKRVQDDKDEVVIEQMMSSITCEICGSLLELEEFVSEDTEYPEGSLGRVARSWLLQSMPGRTLPEIKNEFRRSPNIIFTALRGLSSAR